MSVRSKNKRAGEAPAEPDIDTSDLPEGWAVAKLQDIGAWRSGGTPSRTKPEYFGQGIPWVKSGDLPDGPITKTDEQITQLGLDNSAAKLMPPGTICMALYGATIGKLGTMTFEAATNQATANLIPDERVVDGQYVFYYLMSERQNFIDLGQGGAQPNISQEIVRKHPFKLAPLAEQRRIVGKLELLLGKVSSSQQRLSRSSGLLKRFRQSVLAAACSGKLTADWREENEVAPIDAPTEIDIPAEFPTLPESWSWTTLESVCVKVVDCPHSTPKWTDAGKLCIRTTNFRPGILDLSEVRFVSAATFDERIERLRPAPGDIVYSREGGILGIACQIPPGVELCLGQRMMIFRVGSEYTATLLMHWLNSPVITHRVKKLTGGSASPHLNVRDIRAFPTPAPPLSEQQEIVRRVEKLFAFADQIESRLRQAKSHIDRLTQSLLAKAFRGELVPTEHTLATAAGRDYESADALLARITSLAETVTQQPQMPRGTASKDLAETSTRKGRSKMPAKSKQKPLF